MEDEMASRLALTIAAAVFALSPEAGQPTATAPKPMQLYPVEVELVSQTNLQRKRYGLPPLKIDRKLMLSARQHCIWMARTYSLQHTSASVAENIAMGQGTSREVVADWMTSPGHRMNILHPGYKRIGVAAYQASDGTIFWCQQFLYGEPEEEVPLPGKPAAPAGAAASESSENAEATTAGGGRQGANDPGTENQPSAREQSPKEPAGPRNESASAELTR